ncbi:MAG: flagellar biosynthesis protein FlhB [Alphaproteobacteria bacterium]|nr:flagellar biosynthesis protein FlhB [Alphaproteobacteria bacterium]
MAEQDQDQKTEAPTGKRLSEARERGEVPVSRETSSWVSMLGILVVMAWMVPPVTRQMAGLMRAFIEQPQNFPISDKDIQALMFHVLEQVGLITGLAFFVLTVAAVGGVMVQTGFFFVLARIEPDLAKLSPMQGIKRLFSTQALVEFGKSIAKFVFLGGVAYAVLAPVALRSPGFTGMPLHAILAFLEKNTIHLISIMLLAFTVIAAGDLFYTRWQYIKNLRMTKEEVKDEFKQMEGDPMIKQRLRQIRAEKARKRMMAQVPKADVVITNPTHYAVALQYDGDKMAAPVVLAKGINLIAERIRNVAEENRIPLVSNPPLSRALYETVEVDQQIPAQHYRAVAEVISYVYKLRMRKP